MINTALNLLRSELNEYVQVSVDNPADVKLENISAYDQSPGSVEDSIVITLVNIEEESALKNIDSRFRNPLTGNSDYAHPPVHLNLYILFTSVPQSPPDGGGGSSDSYEIALQRLSAVIRFFQHRRSFTIQNTPESSLADEATNPNSPNYNPNLIDFKLILDLYTLTFEQINHLWGSLGGKQVPFAMYKARLVEIQEQKVERVGGVITEIHSSEEIF